MSEDPELEPKPVGFEMVMPFVVTISNGGTFDDDAYVAGFETGTFNQWLSDADPDISEFVCDTAFRTANVPQLDLIAMQHGFTMTSREWENDPEWSFCTFTRTKETPT